MAEAAALALMALTTWAAVLDRAPVARSTTSSLPVIVTVSGATRTVLGSTEVTRTRAVVHVRLGGPQGRVGVAQDRHLRRRAVDAVGPREGQHHRRAARGRGRLGVGLDVEEAAGVVGEGVGTLDHDLAREADRTLALRCGAAGACERLRADLGTERGLADGDLLGGRVLVLEGA